MLDNMSCDKVYTFAFWGISQFIDVINWEFRGLFPRFKMDANKLCGRPPVYVVAYQLAGTAEGEEEDHRHLISKKSYYFKVALWSDKKPPESDFLEELLGSAQSSAQGCSTAVSGGSSREGSRLDRTLQMLASLFGRCGGRGP